MKDKLLNAVKAIHTIAVTCAPTSQPPNNTAPCINITGGCVSVRSVWTHPNAWTSVLHRKRVNCKGHFTHVNDSQANCCQVALKYSLNSTRLWKFRSGWLVVDMTDPYVISQPWWGVSPNLNTKNQLTKLAWITLPDWFSHLFLKLHFNLWTLCMSSHGSWPAGRVSYELLFIVQDLSPFAFIFSSLGICYVHCFLWWFFQI